MQQTEIFCSSNKKSYKRKTAAHESKSLLDQSHDDDLKLLLILVSYFSVLINLIFYRSSDVALWRA